MVPCAVVPLSALCTARGGQIPAIFSTSSVVVREAFWYKAALFSRARLLRLVGEAGKTLKKRGALRQMTER